jgi:hypothetical protein
MISATKLKMFLIAGFVSIGMASEARAACQQLPDYVECEVCGGGTCCTTRFITCCEYFYNSCEPE